MSDESEAEVARNALMLNIVVRRMEWKTYPQHLKQEYDAEVGQLPLALQDSCNRAHRLERLELRQNGLSVHLHWKGDAKHFAWFVLDPSTVGEIVLRLHSVFPGNEEGLTVTIEPYASMMGTRLGWKPPGEGVLTQSEFADLCVSRLLDHAARQWAKGS